MSKTVRGISKKDVDTLALACLCDHSSAMVVIDSWITRGVELEDIYLHGIASACRVFGQWWQDDEIDFSGLSLANHRLQHVLYEYSARFLENAHSNVNGYGILFLRTAASQHSIGAFMAAEFFKRAGWSVSCITYESPLKVQRLLQTSWFDVVGYSMSTNHCLNLAKKLIPQLRSDSINKNIQIMVGGSVVFSNPTVARSLGANVAGEDAKKSQVLALQCVNELVHSRKVD